MIIRPCIPKIGGHDPPDNVPTEDHQYDPQVMRLKVAVNSTSIGFGQSLPHAHVLSYSVGLGKFWRFFWQGPIGTWVDRAVKSGAAEDSRQDRCGLCRELVIVFPPIITKFWILDVAFFSASPLFLRTHRASIPPSISSTCRFLMLPRMILSF